MSIRRWCRGAPENGVARNAATIALASSTVFIRPPIEITWALLCSRARVASSVVVAERRTDARDLVGRHLLTVAGAAQHDAERVGVGGHGLRGAQHEDRVVVLGVEGVGPVVGHLVALGLEERDQLTEQLVCRVVAADVDAHLVLLEFESCEVVVARG